MTCERTKKRDPLNTSHTDLTGQDLHLNVEVWRFDLWRLGVDFCKWHRSTSSGELELLHARDLRQKKASLKMLEKCAIFISNKWHLLWCLLFLTAKNVAALSPADMRWCTPSHFVAVHQLLWSLQVVDLLRKKQYHCVKIGQWFLCWVNLNAVCLSVYPHTQSNPWTFHKAWIGWGELQGLHCTGYALWETHTWCYTRTPILPSKCSTMASFMPFAVQ